MNRTFLTKVTEFDPGAGLEYTATSYPGEGLYYNPRMRQIYTIAGGFCYSAAAGWKPEEVAEQRPDIDIARILAVALHRDAAVEVVKKLPAKNSKPWRLRLYEK